MKFPQGFYPVPSKERHHKKAPGNFYFPGKDGVQRFLKDYPLNYYARRDEPEGEEKEKQK